jgi:hypothetical protein
VALPLSHHKCFIEGRQPALFVSFDAPGIRSVENRLSRMTLVSRAIALRGITADEVHGDRRVGAFEDICDQSAGRPIRLDLVGFSMR